MNDDFPDLETIDVTAPQEPVAPGTTGTDGPWPAGWYADPWTAGQYRYWTGQSWSGETNRWGPANAGIGGAQAADAVTDPWPAMSSPSSTGYGWPTPRPAEVSPPFGATPRRRGPMVWGAIALVIVLLVSGGIGYAINSHSHSNKAIAIPPGPTTAPTPTTAPSSSGRAAPQDPDRRVLGGLVVAQTDVNPARSIVLFAKGNSTAEATLDLCNGKFPSESLRTARLQVADEGADGTSSLSTEAVLYRNPAAAAQAFDELRKVSAACPHTPVVSPVGEPTVQTVFNPPPDAKWPSTPTVERLAYSMVTTSAGDATQGPSSNTSIAVYLRRGRALMGVYLPQPNGAQPAVDGQRSVEGIVGVFEARLAKLPAAVVNAHR